MDRIIKLNSLQGGSFTETQNLVDFDIPNNAAAYDLSKSYVNLVMRTEDPHLKGSFDTECKCWNVGDDTDNTNTFHYRAIKFSDVVALGIQPVVSPTISWNKINGSRTNVPLYNVALVKNCSMSSELAGAIEDVRRIDVLRQNLNQYSLTEDQKKSLEYASLMQRTDVDLQIKSIFAETHDDANPSRRLEPHVPIKMNQLFESGNMSKYPASKMGKTRVHLELNLDRIQGYYDRNNPNSQNGKYENELVTTFGNIMPCDTAGLGAGNVMALTGTSKPAMGCPLHTNQLVEVAAVVKTFTPIENYYHGTSGGGSVQATTIKMQNGTDLPSETYYYQFDSSLKSGDIYAAAAAPNAGRFLGPDITVTPAPAKGGTPAVLQWDVLPLAASVGGPTLGLDSWGTSVTYTLDTPGEVDAAGTKANLVISLGKTAGAGVNDWCAHGGGAGQFEATPIWDTSNPLVLNAFTVNRVITTATAASTMIPYVNFSVTSGSFTTQPILVLTVAKFFADLYKNFEILEAGTQIAQNSIATIASKQDYNSGTDPSQLMVNPVALNVSGATWDPRAAGSELDCTAFHSHPAVGIKAVVTSALNVPVTLEVTYVYQGKTHVDNMALALANGSEVASTFICDKVLKIKTVEALTQGSIRIDLVGAGANNLAEYKSFAIIETISENDNAYTFNFAGANGAGNISSLYDATSHFPATGGAQVVVIRETNACLPHAAQGSDGTVLKKLYPSITVPMAELVLHQLGNPGQTPNKIEYMSWSTEQFTTNDKIQYFQRMYQLEPEAVNLLMFFPNDDDLTAGNELEISDFRLRLNNEDLMNRNVKLHSPLYYDRLNMSFVNMAYKMANINERALKYYADPNLALNIGRPGETSTYDSGTNAWTNPTTEMPFAKLCMLSNPVPQTPNEKQLQVNINCANANGVSKAILYKLNMNSVGV